MKKLLLLVIVFTPLALTAQESQPFKGANKVIAEYQYSGDSLFTSIAKMLTAADYTVDKKDKELSIITTEPKKVKFADYKIRIFIRDNKVEVMAKWMSSVTMSVWGAKAEQTWYDAEFVKSKGNIQYDIWHQILGFLQSTAPQQIQFTK